MAYIRKVRGKWKAEVERAGVRMSRTFVHKAAATEWAAKEEAAIIDGTRGRFPAKTVRDAFERYEREVSAHKRGSATESKRFAAILRDFPWLADKVFHQVGTPDLARWRDARLAVVAPASVRRDINLLRNVWTVAANEWKWCAAPGPWKGMKLPHDGPARTRLVGWREVRQLVRWLGYRTGRRPDTKYQEVAWAFMVALATGMRASEVLSLSTATVDLSRRVARLDVHKTLEREGVRHVPLPRRAVRLLGVLLAGVKDSPWTITPATLDAIFRKARDACLLKGLRFHDSRAAGLTWLAKRVDVMTLARISGHRDLNQLLAAYYRETPEAIAARLR